MKHGDHSHDDLTIKSVDKLSPTRVRLTVEFPSESVAQHEKMTANRYSQQARIPGFRPGKAPLKMVMERYKEEILKDTLQHLVEAGFAEACEKAKLEPVTRPQLHFEKRLLNESKPFEFKAEFDIHPEIALKNYKGVPLKETAVEASDEEVNKTVDGLRERLAQLEPVEAKKPEKGMYAVAEIAFEMEDGSKKEDAKPVTVELGADRLLPDLDKALLTMEVGAEPTTVESTFPDDYHDKALAGKKAKFTCKIVELKKKKLPEFDDAFAAQVREGETAESMRKQIRDSITESKKDEAQRTQRSEIVDYLVANHQFDVPQSLLQRQTQALLGWIQEDRQKQGLPPAPLKPEDLTEVQKRAEQMVKSSLLLREIARKESIELDQQKVRERVAALATQFGKSVEETVRLLDGRGMLERLRDEVLTDQVFEFLIANAQKVESAPRA